MASVRASTGRLLLLTVKDVLVEILSFVTFVTFDAVDQLLCPIFAFLDWTLDKYEAPCYCHQSKSPKLPVEKNLSEVLGFSSTKVIPDCEGWAGPSDTLFSRRHRHGRKRVHFLALHRSLSVESTVEFSEHLKSARLEGAVIKTSERAAAAAAASPKTSKQLFEAVSSTELDTGMPSIDEINREANFEDKLKSERIVTTKARWSDCGCNTCTSWQQNGQLLYVRAAGKDVSVGAELGGCEDDAENNVIFIHGFCSSSSFWADTVFPFLSDTIGSSHRLFAVDILGFGKSPKPANCMYSNADHVDMIRRSVVERYGLKKYHLVAHSMGCTIALSMAGQDPDSVKSVTLVSPIYYPSVPGGKHSSHLLWKVAPKKIWPVTAFGPSVMSWYEHLGRVVCVVVCKNHRFWEPVFEFVCNNLLGMRIPPFFFHDFMQHTHNAAWHTFHNTICSGAHTIEWSMNSLLKSEKHVRVIHGDKDDICPLQCSLDLSQHYSNVSLSTIKRANHITVVLGREEAMAKDIEEEILRSQKGSIPADDYKRTF